jgi:predicted nucleic acid-binding protein
MILRCGQRDGKCIEQFLHMLRVFSSQQQGEHILTVSMSSTKTTWQGQLIQDMFQRGLGYAIQWYDILQVQVEQQVESALQSADS